MTISQDSLPRPQADEERQTLDIAKEVFTTLDHLTKSNLTGSEVMVIARSLWFAEKYDIPEIPKVVDRLLLLKRSQGGLVLKIFRDILKNMHPEFKTDGSNEVTRL